MDAAWRGPLPGSVESSVDAIAAIAGVSADVVSRYWDDIFWGWELRDDGRLWHPRLAKIATDLHERYEAQLAAIEAAHVLAMQACAALEMRRSENSLS